MAADLLLAPGTPVLAEGAPLAEVPRLSLDLERVLLGPFTDPTSRDAFVGRTWGSGGPLAPAEEELRFSPTSGALEGAAFRLPGANLFYSDRLDPWWGVEPLRCGLRMPAPADVEVPRPTHFMLDPERDVLAGVHSGPSDPPPPHLASRVRIAEDLDLLFADGLYHGWMLHQPARYLVTGWDSASSDQPDADLTLLLGDYLKLTDQSSFALFLSADPGVRAILEQTQDRIGRLPAVSSQGNSLRRRIDAALERFFPPTGGPAPR